MDDLWRNAILDNIYHGDDGHFQCSEEDAISLCRILIKRGYAVCITGGDIGDDLQVNWLYAGDGDSLDWPRYENVVFTSPDYIDEYPEAFYEDIELEDKKLEDFRKTEQLEEENKKLQEELKELKKKLKSK